MADDTVTTQISTPMINACLAIGIERTAGPGLGQLPGAVNGARAIAAWAKAAKTYAVELVVDQDEQGRPVPVTAEMIGEALMRLLPAANDGKDRGGPADPPRRLIVYFAGHGMQSAVDGEMWLLSNSYNDQMAVGIPKLQSLLQTYMTGAPPGQIAMISDACRSPMIDNWNLRMTPMPVIPLGPYDPNKFDQVDIDQFLAVPPLSSAFMVRANAGAPARCIFTSVLLEALHGAAAGSFDSDSLTSDSLARYLKASVPQRAAQFGVEMRPRVSACWLDPDVYVTRAELAAMNLPPLDPWPGSGPAEPQGGGDGAGIFESFGAPEGVVVRGESAAPGADRDNADMDSADMHGAESSVPRMITIASKAAQFETPSPVLNEDELAQLAAERKSIDEQIAALQARAAMLDALGRRVDRISHQETGCGLTVVGANVLAPQLPAPCRSAPDHQFAGSWRIDLAGDPAGRSAWLLLPLENGGAVVTMALGGFITDCIMAEGGCAVSSFRQMWLDHGVRLMSEDILAHNRLPHLEADDALEWLVTLADENEVFDPMLGVLAAYLFDGAGQVDNVRRLAGIFAARNLPLPFDIALLARGAVTPGDDGRQIAIPAVAKRKARSQRQSQLAALLGPRPAVSLAVAGACPLLRQGWFLLDRAPAELADPRLAPLARHLEPAPFATFDQAGAGALAEILEVQ